jgi:hypothetical protein
MSVLPFRAKENVVAVEQCWSLSIPLTGRVIECQIVRGEGRMWVRCGFSGARPFLTRFALSLDGARLVAARWHRLATDHAELMTQAEGTPGSGRWTRDYLR